MDVGDEEQLNLFSALLRNGNKNDQYCSQLVTQLFEMAHIVLM